MEVLNLDVFQKEFKEIKIGGKSYKVPAEIPTLMFFELMEVTKDGDVAKMEQGLNIMYDIFKIHQPELTFKEFALLFTLKEYTAVINWLFAGISAEETMKRISDAEDQMKDGKKKQPEASE